MVESPYNRPKAVNLISESIDEWQERPANVIGFSLEMYVYSRLKGAGYLTESAMESDEA